MKSYKLTEVIKYYESFNISNHLRLVEDTISNKEHGTKEQQNKMLNVYQSIFTLMTTRDLRIDKEVSDKGYIGYRYKTYIKYYTFGEWKTVLVDEIEYKENDIIIGMYSADMQFKMRDPVNVRAKGIDKRKQPRGAVCMTKSRSELYKIAKKLKIPLTTGGIDEQPITIDEQPTPVNDQPITIDESTPIDEQPIAIDERPITIDEPTTYKPITIDEPPPDEPSTIDEPITDKPIAIDEPTTDKPITRDDAMSKPITLDNIKPPRVLGGRRKKTNAEPKQTTGLLCDAIKQELIRRESNGQDGVKWLYLY